MRYGIILTAGSLHEMIQMAGEAEDAGWDGVFYWDAVSIPGLDPIYDPWVALAAFAMRTERVRLGNIITPPSRRRPWKLARETATLDHLSGGRLVLPVGLGATPDFGFGGVGEATDLRTRAELLDESLEILTRAWSGEPFRHQGRHYQTAEMTLRPPSLQQPRIPIWVVAGWPRPKSVDRALRYDGIIPQIVGDGGAPRSATPDDVQAIAMLARAPPGRRAVRHRDRGYQPGGRPGCRARDRAAAGGGRRDVVDRVPLGKRIGRQPAAADRGGTAAVG